MLALVKLTPVSLRGLAHPLRVRMLGLLRRFGPATATMLAERLGQSTGATSYHLRQLALYGFVVEETSLGVRRERFWKAAHKETLFDSTSGDFAPEEVEAYFRSIAAQTADRIDQWLSSLATLPAAWNETGTISDWRLRLTAAEALALQEKVFELVRTYRRADSDPESFPDGAADLVFQLQMLPFPEAEVAE
jgi:DNA-binding transcriptional ArsR family regulator